MSEHENNEPKVSFIITGFGPFHGVNENPTTYIVNHLQSEFDKGQLEHQIEFTKVIETSASSAKQEVAEIIKYIQHLNVCRRSVKDLTTKHVVILHFGVNHMNGKKPAFQIEQNAFNEANFRVADEEGFMPKNESIISNNPISEKLTTDINVRRVIEKIGTEYDTVLSGDAGRFVCNYIYYTTLNSITNFVIEDGHESAVHLHSLFVHVPKFDSFAKEIQLSFSKRLLSSISDTIISKVLKDDKKNRKENMI